MTNNSSLSNELAGNVAHLATDRLAIFSLVFLFLSQSCLNKRNDLAQNKLPMMVSIPCEKNVLKMSIEKVVLTLKDPKILLLR